jgi:phosphoribosyl 1,2-cyclic phosphodiesterase
VRAADGEHLVLDCGIGLHYLGHQLQRNGTAASKRTGHILFTHTHWGHIQGIPFFLPLLMAGNRFDLYGAGEDGGSLEATLLKQMATYYCPVPPFFEEGIGADLAICDLGESECDIGSTRVISRRVPHGADCACLGYRLESSEASLAYIPDVEYADEEQRRIGLELARGVDLLIHDAHFTSDEYPGQRGLGHCCDGDAVGIAAEAGVGRLLLFHHHPDRTDADIDAMVASHRDAAVPVEGAREGAEYALGESE